MGSTNGRASVPFRPVSRPRNGRLAAGGGEFPPPEVARLYEDTMRAPLARAARIGTADIVIGIPFLNESESIGHVIRTIRAGLRKYYPHQRAVIVAVGGPGGREALRAASAAMGRGTQAITFLLQQEELGGKGWGVWAIMDVARTLGADLAILEADLQSREKDGVTEGLSPRWVYLLLEPIRRLEMDLVTSRFRRHLLEAPASTLFFYPLLRVLYGYPLYDIMGGQLGMSYRLLQDLMQHAPYPPSAEVSGYGVDAWLVAAALSARVPVCEANLGVKMHRPAAAKAEMIFRQAARAFIDQAVADHDLWETSDDTEVPLLRPVPVFGDPLPECPDEIITMPERLVDRYHQRFATYEGVFERLMPPQQFEEMKALAEDAVAFHFPHRLWAKIVYQTVFATAFVHDIAEGDFVAALTAAYSGYLGSLALRGQHLRERLDVLGDEQALRFVCLDADQQVEALADEFVRQKADFLAVWESHEEALKPPVPNVTYREFIPGVPLVVPSELARPDGGKVTANEIYDRLFQRYCQEFNQFVHEGLGLPAGATSQQIVAGIRAFIARLESGLAGTLMTSDLTTVEGARAAVELVLGYFRRRDILALSSDMAGWLLWRYPPTNLLTKLGYSHLNALLEDYDPNDVLALASWVEEHDYKEQMGALIRESVRPEHFVPRPLKVLTMDLDEFPFLAEMRESPSLSRVAGRVVVGNLHKGTGGEYPRLRYLTTVAKNTVEAERFSDVWKQFAWHRKDFGERVLNALEAHWGKAPLSAHNIFENGHHRVLVARLREMADTIVAAAPRDRARQALAADLKLAAQAYHLALTLPDGTFIPCSIWSWASYSSKGGTGVPTPLSLHVERDWASRDFLTEYYVAAGGRAEGIDEAIRHLMAQGREYEDLGPILFGMEPADQVIRPTLLAEEQPPAQPLLRYRGNPVLHPVSEHYWESRYVLNPGAIHINGRVYLVYRAVGEDGISRLGLAVSEDGFNFSERLDKPVFEPATGSESYGCEDPRLTLIGDRIYMAYTAYSRPVAQIALASISVSDFVRYRWGGWHRHGLVFPGFTDKDAALFPERFGGKYAILHRVDPHIWISFSGHLRCPWPRKEHTILAGSRTGMAWDGRKIGGGAPPIKTRYGWLLITHGVDSNHVYRLGVMLLDLDDPTVLRYRSPNWVLGPEEQFEVGEDGESWVPNVVFTCGAVPRAEGKAMLEADDEVLVYYGAADSVIGVASARVADLVPEEFRQT